MGGVIFNKSDYKILADLVQQECFSEITSFNIKQISEHTKLSIPKIRIVLKNFLIAGFIAEGAKDGISKTYYATEIGIKFLNKALYPNINENEEE